MPTAHVHAESPSAATAVALLHALTEAHGTSGSEGAVRRIVAAQLAHGPAMTSDRTGGILQELPAPGDLGASAPRVMVTAHMDEVGFMVQSVTSDGFLRFTPLGGWWGHTLLAQRVRILTRAGVEILGLITSTPPHLLSAAARDKVLTPEDMYIDVGAASAAEVRESFGIQLGDPIVPDSAFTRLHKPNLLMCKAFDNRVGVATAVQTMQALRTTRHPNTVVGAFSVQEEVGTRGAQTIAAAARPDVALVLEGAPADDQPGSRRADCQGAVGAGPQVRMYDPTAIMNRELVQLVIDTAADLDLPIQLAVRKSGGTDAKVIHLHDIGVPTIVISVPARYIHTHNAIIDLHDYMQAVDLVCAVVQRLDREAVDRLTRFL